MPDRSILITGCSSGIGRHCALRLHQAGWQVFATARKPSDIADLNDAGLTALHLDYRDETSIEAAFGAMMDVTGGRIDALFNNGAFGQAGAVEDLATDVLREQFEANFFGWHSLTRRVVPIMREQGHGRIVHCSSVLGFVPYRWRGAYNASKFALEGLAATQRMELSDAGIHVVLIQPGPIRSRFGENGVKHFLEKVDVENSVHAETYKRHLANMRDGGGVNRFRLGPEAVYRKLDHALNADRPRFQYAVTVPTHAMGFAKRVLPVRLLEKLLMRSG